ncbi:MAG TPA: DinB family protein [Gemmatimonadales bacterium]|jgi:hypothetical protein
MSISRPVPEEFPPYYGTYIKQVAGEDALPVLISQRESTRSFLAGIPESRASFRYAPDKWSLREIIGHLSDSERVFAYRMLRFARADQAPLAGFDENAYVPAGEFERRSLADVAAEFTAVRDASLAMIRSFDEAALARRGSANGKEISVRALAWVLPGHEAHHLKVIRERYL